MELPDTPCAPEWVTSEANAIKGLDLLGLRLPAQTISNSLLDGVTTITPSVRYLALRCWLTNAYIRAKRPDDWKSFRSFADRVEAAVAFGNVLVNPNGVGVVGSDGATERLRDSHGRLGLERLVQQPAVSNYANPSDALGLTFSTDSGVPGLTRERGLLLAEAAAETLEECPLGKALGAGRDVQSATVADLRKFGNLARVDVIPDAERQLLIDVLLPPQPRESEWPRLSTYALLLHLGVQLKRVPEEEDIFGEAAAPSKPGRPEALDEPVDGWLRFSVRDMLAVAHEMVAAAAVDELGESTGEGEVGARPEAVLRSLLGHEPEHNEALRSFGLLRSRERFRSLSFEELRRRVGRRMSAGATERADLRRWRGDLQEGNLIRAFFSAGPASLVLLPVAWLVAANRSADAAEAGSPGGGAMDSDGWYRIGLATVIQPTIESLCNRNASLPQAMSELALRSVDQHTRVAWARIAADPRRDVAVLSEDEGLWYFKSRLEAGRTASRLYQAISWLCQLGLLDERGATAEGRAVLERSLAALASSGVR